MKRIPSLFSIVLFICVFFSGVLAATAHADRLFDPNGTDYDGRDFDRAPRAALFWADGFPSVDAAEVTETTLNRALDGFDVERLSDVDALNQKLRVKRHDVLILPYGSAFPLDAWWTIRSYVERGGGLVVLGGAPFHQPVSRTDDGWRLESRQPTFAHPFLIAPAERWQRSADERFTSVAVDESGWTMDPGKLSPAEGADVWHLTIRLARVKDLPPENGSEGHRDAILRPLIHWLDADGVPRACPLLEIDRIRGRDAGGRWVFAPTNAPLDAETIRAMVARALFGAFELDARPVYASLEEGEPARIRVVVRKPFVRKGEPSIDEVEVEVRDPEGNVSAREKVSLLGTEVSRHGELVLAAGKGFQPGLHHVIVTLPGEDGLRPTVSKTGFWVRDVALLASSEKVTVSKDWIRWGERVLPVVGATYMASDIQRKFLFEPDPYVFDKDFALMAEHGVNFVRTGIWTAWSRAMLNSGALDEGVLRALDAYIQSAARHGILVNFTFFAFSPPHFGGSHPYLDPRALEGQGEMLTMVAKRYRGVHWVHWDLINEPSYSPPDRLWTNQPIHDEHERQAWAEWVRERHGDDLSRLRARWQDSSRYIVNLPHGGDLHYAMIREDRRPRKAGDFVRFSNHVVTEWARELRSILREAGGDVLVTLGQDEGGIQTRPSQQLHAEAVDYTGVHPWWQNADLLATGIQVKVPEKPNLFQETGLMRLEGLDGEPWRTPERAAQLLERKYAYAFASRGAGSINWAWNINPYQPIDNEAVIGIWRPDGTAKPELRVISEFGEFFREAAPWLDDYDPDPVVVVIPHSRLFMGRPGATDGLKRIVRALAGYHGTVPTGLSELRLTAERLADARLVIVPYAEVLEPSASAALLKASKNGTRVLFMGPVTSDAFGEQGPELQALGIADRGRPVRLHEETQWAGGWVTFDRNMESLLRSQKSEPLQFEGNLWHEPLPLDHVREEAPLVEMLGKALKAADVKTLPTDEPLMTRLLPGPKSILVVLVNETGEDVTRKLDIEGRDVQVPVAAGRSRLVLFERPGGRFITSSPGEPVVVD